MVGYPQNTVNKMKKVESDASQIAILNDYSDKILELYKGLDIEDKCLKQDTLNGMKKYRSSHFWEKSSTSGVEAGLLFKWNHKGTDLDGNDAIVCG